jgi:hypothetical protein
LYKLFIFKIIFLYSVNSLTFTKFPLTYIPLIDLGEVDLKDVSDCDQHLRTMKDKCENYYIRAVNETKFRYWMDINTESFRKAVCCGIWRMNTCVAKAAEGIQEWETEVAKRYEVIPNDRGIKEEVLNKCSEYKENTLICDFAIKLATNLCFSFIISLIFSLILSFIWF